MDQWGVHIDENTRAEAIKKLDQPQVIFTPNPEILLEARRNASFRKSLETGTLMLPDGHGLLLVSTLMKVKSKWVRALLYPPSLFLFLIWKHPFKKVFPEIIHGSDFMLDVARWAEKNKKSVYFLGGKEDAAQKTAELFKKKFSELEIAGFSSEDPSEMAFKLVRESKAKVLFVAYGAPKQEEWIAQYTEKLKLFHVMGVGGSFDFWSGNIKRAPLLLRKLGLEWLWRLFLNPRQRCKRIWKATVQFPIISLFFS